MHAFVCVHAMRLEISTHNLTKLNINSRQRPIGKLMLEYFINIIQLTKSHLIN